MVKHGGIINISRRISDAHLAGGYIALEPLVWRSGFLRGKREEDVKRRKQLGPSGAIKNGRKMPMQLMQGDCLVKMLDIPDGTIDMILCDLPYGTTACKWDSVIPFEPLWEQYRRVIKDHGAICLFGSEPFSTMLRQSNLKGFRYDWIWEKEQGANFMLCKYQPYKVHEIVSVFSKKRCRYFPQMTAGKAYVSGKGTSGEITGSVGKIRTVNMGTRYPRSVQRFNTEKRKSYHPTQKPVALLEYLIRTYSQPGETVLDNCMGSGSTGVACVKSGRDFIGIEKDQKYFQIAQERIQEAVEAAGSGGWIINKTEEGVGRIDRHRARAGSL